MGRRKTKKTFDEAEVKNTAPVVEETTTVTVEPAEAPEAAPEQQSKPAVDDETIKMERQVLAGIIIGNNFNSIRSIIKSHKFVDPVSEKLFGCVLELDKSGKYISSFTVQQAASKAYGADAPKVDDIAGYMVAPNLLIPIASKLASK